MSFLDYVINMKFQIAAIEIDPYPRKERKRKMLWFFYSETEQLNLFQALMVN